MKTKSPTDCFDVAQEAWRIAVRFMTPVFLMTDGYIPRLKNQKKHDLKFEGYNLIQRYTMQKIFTSENIRGYEIKKGKVNIKNEKNNGVGTDIAIDP